MEVNFILLVFAALAGMVAKLAVAWDPWKLLGTLSLITLVLPVVQLGFIHDTESAQVVANGYIARLVNALPSIIIGEIAGVVAGTIFGFSADIARLFR